MSYQVLALKWRPKTFDEVVGQGTVTKTLRNAIATGRIGHAFLLSGARGVGKTTTARLLAKALNCAQSDKPTPDPCGACASCTEIAAGSSLDVQEIDGATHNGVEQVRELRESARYNPARDRFKIWIIDEVHMLSTGAFNALLKTLEEPPPRVKFIFATTEYHKIPDTILSRCQQYDFRMIPAREIQAHLERIAAAEEISVSRESLARIARAAEGSARDALSLFDQVLAFSDREVRDEDLPALLGLIDRELLLAASSAVAGADGLGLVELVERLADYGADYRAFTRDLILHFRELLLLKLAPADSPLLAQVLPEDRQRAQPVATQFSQEDLLRILDLLTKLEQDLRVAQDQRVTLELALLKLAQLRHLVPIAELVARLERLEGGEPTPASARPAAASPARRTSATAAPPSPPQPVAAPVRPAPPSTPAPAVAAPAPAAPSAGAATVAPPAGDSDAGAILERMVELARPRQSLYQPLRTARATLAGDALSLEIAPHFAAFAALHGADYAAFATEAAGRKLKVAIVAGETAPVAAPTRTPQEERTQRLIDKAKQEPAVREALDLFGGKLAGVREANERG